jgi:hypothetical protein
MKENWRFITQKGKGYNNKKIKIKTTMINILRKDLS